MKTPNFIPCHINGYYDIYGTYYDCVVIATFSQKLDIINWICLN